MEIKLFGSAARGESHEDSDIDILVLLKHYDLNLRKRLISIATDLTLVAGSRLRCLNLNSTRSFCTLLHLLL
ncbi:MAG: nucleotidyltransferase family protein [Bacillota bacterium]